MLDRYWQHSMTMTAIIASHSPLSSELTSTS